MPRIFDAWNFVKSVTTWPLLVALLIGGIIGAVLAKRFFSDDEE